MREDEFLLLFFDAQSDIDALFKILEVSIAKSIAFDVLDEFICCLNDEVTIVRKNGIIFDFVLDGEEVGRCDGGD